MCTHWLNKHMRTTQLSQWSSSSSSHLSSERRTGKMKPQPLCAMPINGAKCVNSTENWINNASQIKSDAHTDPNRKKPIHDSVVCFFFLVVALLLRQPNKIDNDLHWIHAVDFVECLCTHMVDLGWTTITDSSCHSNLIIFNDLIRQCAKWCSFNFVSVFCVVFPGLVYRFHCAICALFNKCYSSILNGFVFFYSFSHEMQTLKKGMHFLLR